MTNENTFTASEVFESMTRQVFADFYEEEFVTWLEDERHSKFTRKELIERLERVLTFGKKRSKGT